MVEPAFTAVAFDVTVGLSVTPSAFVTLNPVPDTAIERDAAVLAPVRVISPLADSPEIAVNSASNGCRLDKPV